MPVWQWLLDSAGLLLLVVLGYGLALVVRRRVLSRHGGTFELSVRVRSNRAGRGWVLGLGRYNDDLLEWFRIFSLSPWPKRRYRRDGLELLSRRQPQGPEAYSLYAGHLIVECVTPEGRLELAMSPDAVTGFQSWLEAVPPGTRRAR